MGYNHFMIEIRKTDIFAKWIDSLQDIRGRARIQAKDIKTALLLARNL